jgi:hypothetical protein
MQYREHIHFLISQLNDLDLFLQPLPHLFLKFLVLGLRRGLPYACPWPEILAVKTEALWRRTSPKLGQRTMVCRVGDHILR